MFEIKEINETSIEYVFSSNIDEQANKKVLSAYNFLKSNLDFGVENILDLIPTYNTLAIHFNSSSKLFTDIHGLDKDIKKALTEKSLQNSQEYQIEVDYCGEDLDELSSVLDLSKEELINIHTKSTYTIAMLGFREYFPYLFGLDERLTIPRRNKPRLEVKKGAVAIAAGQCGIYSQNSPGGWHILGYTDFDDFENLQASDTIIFRRKDVN